MNDKFNLLHHVGIVAKTVCAAAAAAETAHEGDDNTPSGLTGPGVKNTFGCHGLYKNIAMQCNAMQCHTMQCNVMAYNAMQ